MAGWNVRRLDNLEAACSERPRMLVLKAEPGQGERALRTYYEATVEAARAELIVVVIR